MDFKNLTPIKSGLSDTNCGDMTLTADIKNSLYDIRCRDLYQFAAQFGYQLKMVEQILWTDRLILSGLSEGV